MHGGVVDNMRGAIDAFGVATAYRIGLRCKPPARMLGGQTRRSLPAPTNGGLEDWGGGAALAAGLRCSGHRILRWGSGSPTMRGWQAASDKRFVFLMDRVDKAQKRTASLADAVGAHMDMEAHVEDIVRQSIGSMTEMQQRKIDNRLDEKQKHRDSALRTVQRHSKEIRATTKTAPAMAAAPPQAARTTPLGLNIVVITSFKSDTPRNQLVSERLQVAECMKPLLIRDMMEVFAPFIIGAMLHARSARRVHIVAELVSFRRSPVVVMDGVDCKRCTTLQKPQEVRARNKRLIALQRSKQVETYQAVCWCSNAEVFMNEACLVRHNFAAGTTRQQVV